MSLLGIIGMVAILPIMIGFWIWLTRSSYSPFDAPESESKFNERHNYQMNRNRAVIRNGRSDAADRAADARLARSSAHAIKFAEENPRSGEYF